MQFKKTTITYLITALTLSALPDTRGSAQTASGELLTLEQAIETALDHNYNIKLVSVDVEQAKRNNTAGNAGMLPSITALGGLNSSVANTHLELASGDVQDRKNAAAYGVHGGVQLDWTLFDGMAMFVRKQQLNKLEQMGTVALKQEVQATIESVIQAYAAVIRQQQQLVAIDTAMSLAKARRDIAQRKFEIGSVAKTDYLQAYVDYNAARAQYFEEEILLLQSKDSLQFLMGNPPSGSFKVQPNLNPDTSLRYKEPTNWMDQNFSMQLMQQQRELSVFDWRLTKAAQLPELSVTASYAFNIARNGAGVVAYNRNFGPQAGLNLSLPLFNGGQLQRQKKVAQQEVFRQDLFIGRLAECLKLQYRRAWWNYDNARKRFLLELENIDFAAENVMIQQARFKVGIANTLELREAETSYVNAMSRKVVAAYDLTIAATRLLALENKLLHPMNKR